MSKNSAGSSSQHQFARAPMVHAPRSTFDRSSSLKTTLDAGLVVPFFLDEILPGDTMQLRTNFLSRLATPIFPYMDNLYMDVHYFFVPNRLVWNNWERFNGAQDDPGDSTDYLTPQVKMFDGAFPGTGFVSETYGSLTDYFGLPVMAGSGDIDLDQTFAPQSMPYRAYNLIWNEWYRDENLQNSLIVQKDDGPDPMTQYAVRPRGRRKDYFTSALPWPQKGPSAVLPLGTKAPVATDAANDSIVLGVKSTVQLAQRGIITGGTYASLSSSQVEGTNGALYADLTAATAATINQLRQAATLQQLFETDARGGTRYVELLLAHFGVVSPDARLQRPEYLGGGTINVNVNPIAQTSETDGSPQGNLAAFATANGAHGFNHSFVEHGFVLGLVSYRAETTYQGGMHRMWTRRTRYDYYWPTLAHLGEQAVLNSELFFMGTQALNNAVFGYQERFAEYRYKPSTVTGKFRSNDPQSLDAWHLAVDPGVLTAVSFPLPLTTLVVENPPVDRIIAVPSEPQFLLDTYTSIKHTRRMPVYSVPGITRL